MDVFFLAAGLGTRFKPVTDVWPKPCIPFLNVPMGLYHFRYLQNFNFNKLIVNTHHHPEKIQNLYKNQPYYKNEIVFSHEPAILDTAGGLKKAFKNKKDGSPILMMNADEIIFPKDDQFLKKAIQLHQNENALATLVVMQHPEAGTKFGAIWCDNKSVKNIGRKNENPKLMPWHYIGIIILDPKILKLIEENKPLNIFYDVLINHLKSEKVQIFPIESNWYETGNPKDFLYATETMLSKFEANYSLKEFINRYDESTLMHKSLISNAIKCDELDLQGFNVISKNSILKSNHFENKVVFADQIIGQ